MVHVLKISTLIVLYSDLIIVGDFNYPEVYWVNSTCHFFLKKKNHLF